MTAPASHRALDPTDAEDDHQPLTVDTARERAHAAALVEAEVGSVGLEIETHLVDLADVGVPPAWERVAAVPSAVRRAAGRSSVTLEPGGQVELSGPPAPDVTAAATELRDDMQRVRMALAERGLGAAHIGADPLRPSQRLNPRPRYQAMEQHYTSIGRAAAGLVMMNSTAAMQVNLDAGPRPQWAQRVARAYRLGPTMLAISANSRWLHGGDSGWWSARQRAWSGLDERVSGTVPGCVASDCAHDTDLDPASAWAACALRAPVAFVRGDGDATEPVEGCVSFEQWASGDMRLGDRLPTAADLDTHLTTLFPPVRLRGYLELRYLDMTAPRWWPAIAAVVVTLMDDPVAADLASEATEHSAGRWVEAARDGLDDAGLADAARRCLAIAERHAPSGLSSAVADLAECVESGDSPGRRMARHIEQAGPRAALEELAHA